MRLVEIRTFTEMGTVQRFESGPKFNDKIEAHDLTTSLYLIKDGSTIEICRLAVIASMRRKKIGQLLVQEICQVANSVFSLWICQFSV